MTTWEYASILSDGPAEEIVDGLGAEGWELVTVLQGAQTMQLLYVFKRPARDHARAGHLHSAAHSPLTGAADTYSEPARNTHGASLKHNHGTVRASRAAPVS